MVLVDVGMDVGILDVLFVLGEPIGILGLMDNKSWRKEDEG